MIFNIEKHPNFDSKSYGQVSKKGGKIVYATCSLEPEENVGVVDEFLSKNKNFSIIPPNNFLPQDWVSSDGFLMTMPYETGSDGLFGAVLKKK